MQRFAVIVSLIILTVVACFVNDELFGLITLAAWGAAFCVRLFNAHEEYRSYRAHN